MKTMLICLTMFVGLSTQAASLKPIECKEQMLKKAFLKKTEGSTLDFLLNSTFEIADFQNLDSSSGYDNFDYVATIETKDRSSGQTVSTSYALKVIDINNCKIASKMMAD